jgi:hypothetical protein
MLGLPRGFEVSGVPGAASLLTSGEFLQGHDPSNSLKSVRISIPPPPEFIDRHQPLFRCTAQPILQILPNLRVIIHTMNL